MTDTTTDKGLVERLEQLKTRYGAVVPLTAAIDDAIADIERLERERDAVAARHQDSEAEVGRLTSDLRACHDRLELEVSRRAFKCRDFAFKCRDFRDRALDAEARPSRITAPVEGMETTAEARADYRLYAEEGERTWHPRLILRFLNDLETLSARLRVAEEALEPFAAYAENTSDDGSQWVGGDDAISDNFTPQDFRRAASIRARGES